jgi:hypothetical protein
MYCCLTQDITDDERYTIARVCNIIKSLANQKAYIDETMIVFMLEAASEYSSSELLSVRVQKEIVEIASRKIELI